jgi:hypothetical protein
MKYANPDLHLNRGTAYKYMEYYIDALKDFEKSLTIDATESTQKDIAEIN